MGNTTSLRVAIQQGRWRDVKNMLEEDDGARQRARTKAYHISEAGTAGQTATALHLACLHNPPEDIVRTLIGINPNSPLATSNPSGEVPLHCAVRCTKSGPADSAVRVLIESCPQSVSCRSSQQYGARTPLHLACAVQAHPTIITMLRDADPVAARTLQDGRGETAWDIAKKKKSLLSLIWKWRVRAILRSQSSIRREEAASGTEQVRLDGLPMDVPNANSAAAARFSSTAPSAPPLPSREEEETPLKEGEEMCVVCWSERADHAIVPCGHLCLGSQCSTFATLQGKLHGKCPVCTNRAQSAMRVFHAGVPNPEASSDATCSTPTVPALGNATGSGLPTATGTLVDTLP